MSLIIIQLKTVVITINTNKRHLWCVYWVRARFSEAFSFDYSSNMLLRTLHHCVIPLFLVTVYYSYALMLLNVWEPPPPLPSFPMFSIYVSVLSAGYNLDLRMQSKTEEGTKV